jgi:hypothetical protein
LVEQGPVLQFRYAQTKEVSRNEDFNEDRSLSAESCCYTFYQWVWLVDGTGQRDQLLDNLRTISAAAGRGSAGSGRSLSADHGYNHRGKERVEFDRYG